jgi:hypothetical protein
MLGWGRSKAGNVDRQKCLRPKAVSRRRIASFEDVKASSGKRATERDQPPPKASRHQYPRRRFTRATASIAGAAANRLMAVAPEIGPAPHEKREVVAMQLSAQRVVSAGARIAAHQGEQYPTARIRRIGVPRDIGNAAKAPRGHQKAASPYGSAYACHVRLSGLPASASCLRFKARGTFKQPARRAPRKNANVQSAPTSRQCLPGTFKE